MYRLSISDVLHPLPSIVSSPPRSEPADIVKMIPFVADMTDENPQTDECRKRSRLT